MASRVAKIAFRITLAIIILSILFYVGRPLYWKISATIHDIRHNKLTVSGGISEIVSEAQKLSGGWFHDESDSGIHDVSKARFLRQVL